MVEGGGLHGPPKTGGAGLAGLTLHWAPAVDEHWSISDWGPFKLNNRHPIIGQSLSRCRGSSTNDSQFVEITVAPD